MVDRGLGQALVQAGLITETQLEEALRLQREAGGELAQVLLQLGFVTKEALEQHMNTGRATDAAAAGSADAEQVQPAAVQEAAVAAPPAAPGRKLFGQILIESGRIDEAQLQEALQLQRIDGIRIGEALVRLGYISDEIVYQTLATQFGLEFVSLSDFVPVSSVMRFLPEEFMEQNCVLPMKRDLDGLLLAIGDPVETSAVDAVRYLTGLEVRVVLATPQSIQRVVHGYFHRVTAPPTEGKPSTAPKRSAAPPPPAGASHAPSVSEDTLSRAVIELLDQKGILSRAEILKKAEELARAAKGT